MKSFFGAFFGTLFAIAFFVIGGIVILFVLIALLSSSAEKTKTIPAKSLLVLDLTLPINDAPSAFNASQLLASFSGQEERTLQLRDVLRAIQSAASDSHIGGIFITGSVETSSYASGYAALREVRQALLDFKKSNKPVFSYVMVPNTRAYYVDSVADKVFIDPQSEFLMAGLASERMFFADALKKYGIGVQVTRVGKYKSFVEPFILNQMSPENRQQTEQLLDDLWQEVTNSIEQSRGLSAGAVQELVSQKGVISGPVAIQAKLGTELKSLDAVMDELKDQFASDSKNNTFRQVTIQNYLANLDGPNVSPVTGPRVAVVYAEGDIVDGEGTVGEIGGDRLARAIRKFRFDPDVKGIVLRVNSPGGSALASEVIRRELAAAQNSKPIVVSMGTVAASGGYWISTASNHIFAEPNTITGSIGVFGLEFNFQKIANDNGVTWDGVKTSPFADLLTVSRPKTPAELAVIQGFVDDVYNQFLEHVSKARNLPVDQVGEIAQGRVWSGTQALKIHLIDEFGGLNQAIGYAGKLAGLGETPKIVEYPAKGTLAEKLKEIVGENERPPVSKLDAFTKELRRIELDWAELTRLNDPKGVYARLPFGLRPE